jgi:ABC-type Fe3+/spermidine/putrescine transport system ATPase subunit
LRESLVQDLRRIIKHIGLTAIYVTHDQQEAYSIADRIAIMNKGKIEQIDSPENLYQHPKTAFIARFLGLANLIPAESLRPYIALDSEAEYVLIHPESLALDEEGQIRGIILERIFQGDSYRLKVEIAEGFTLSLHLPSSAPVPNVNQEIRLRLDSSRLIPMSNR